MDTLTKDFSALASHEAIERTLAALKQNGMETFFVKRGADAKQKVLELLPQGSEVMTMTSITLQTIGILAEINESGRYNSVRKQLTSMDRTTQGAQMRKLGAAPDYVLGSVHALTQQGQVFIASNTGSQLPAYAYGAGKVIWVVGAQKIVANTEGAFKRIYEYCLPLERERAKKAYGSDTTTAVSKILRINKELQQGRITLMLVNEVLGF